MAQVINGRSRDSGKIDIERAVRIVGDISFISAGSILSLEDSGLSISRIVEHGTVRYRLTIGRDEAAFSRIRSDDLSIARQRGCSEGKKMPFKPTFYCSWDVS